MKRHPFERSGEGCCATCAAIQSPARGATAKKGYGVKLPILSNGGSLCDQCVALCCRYFAFQIEKPATRRDFEDLRWYLLHEDVLLFVEEGDWYIQINRKCSALTADNRCGVYENRPSICREYKTDGCDWHADEYDYQHMFTEPAQLEAFAKEYLARKRKRRARAARKSSPRARANGAKRRTRAAGRARRAVPVRLLKSA